MLCFWNSLLKHLNRIEKKVDMLISAVEKVQFMVNRPRPIELVVTGELDMAIKFAVALPVPPAIESDWNEVASGELTVRIPGVDPIVIATTKEDQLTETRQVVNEAFVAPQGTVIEAEFLYIDDAGNRGAAVTAQAELLDTVPPVVPGELGIVATEEVPDL